MTTAYVPIPNLQARVLPAAGVYYTGAQPMRIPGRWSENHDGAPSITFRVTYTKGMSSSGGYPVIRVVWLVQDETGANVEMIDPITTAGADGVCITEGATNELAVLVDGNPVSTGVVYTILREATMVRMEVAEMGDTAHPGTVTVAMLGGL